jgi:hypothetical protein
MPEAAPQAQAPAAPPPSVHERLKSFFSEPSNPAASGDSPAADGGVAQTHSKATPEAHQGRESAPPEDKQVPAEANAEADQADDSGDVQSDDAQSEEQQFSNLTELLEAGGFDLDKGLDLEFPVKIDGKEGTAKLRDLVKSYQLDGHINQKLASVDTDRKALMAEREKFVAERSDKLLKMDAGLKTLERALIGEFQSVPWEKLAAEDPAAYNAQVVAFQQRQAYLQDIGSQIAQEQQQFQTQQQEQFTAYLAEQKKMLQAKIPEWSDETRRSKDKAEIVAYLGTHGISKEEFEAVTDHRYALVVRDAQKWHQLQKSKPAVLNKVKAAPKLLKPGTKQSKDVVTKLASNRERETLRQSGKVRDAVPALKRLLFQ